MIANPIERQVLLNQVAQAIRGIDDLLNEIASADDGSRLAWFDDLAMSVSQAHPQPAEIDRAIVDAGLRPTFTPCVFLKAKPLGQALAAMRCLPTSEAHKSFRVLVALLGIADERRRRGCERSCHHWWHQNLRDSKVVESILNGGDATQPGVAADGAAPRS